MSYFKEKASLGDLHKPNKSLTKLNFFLITSPWGFGVLGFWGFEEDKVPTEGAAELDIVYSGLEEIMQHAVQENWQFAIDENLSFRNACFVNAIQKVHRSRMETGMMI